MQAHPIFAFVAGLLVGGSAVYLFTMNAGHTGHTHHDHHPIADPYDTEYHVHADFHIVVNGTKVDLSGDAFQTTSEQELHDHLHLHDNNGDTLHIHAEGLTFAEFLSSLGIEITNECITLDNQYCSNDTEELLLFVNNEQYTDDLTTYIPVDDDRILLYYGEFDEGIIRPLLDAVPNDACYYSGTCPERGVAPPESCGETCEL